MSAVAFALLPYLALATLLGVPLLQRLGRIPRPRRPQYGFVAERPLPSSGRALRIGAVGVFLVHLAVGFAPRTVVELAASPLRLLALETAALTAGLLLMIGIAARARWAVRDARVRAVATLPDAALLAAVTVCVACGLWTALAYRWAVSWGAAAVAPYLASLLRFSPDVELAASLPLGAQLHLIAGWLAVGLLPFSSLGRRRLFRRSL